MRAVRELVPLLLLAGIGAGCARHPAPAPLAPQPAAAPVPAPAARAPAPAPAPAPPAEQPDLAGQWQYTASLGSDVITGTLTLNHAGASYTGTATASGLDDVVPMTSMTVTGAKVVMHFDTPNGEARLDAVLSGGTVIAGTLAIHEQTGTFRAQKVR